MEMSYTTEPTKTPNAPSGVSPNHSALYLRRIGELEMIAEQMLKARRSDQQTIAELDDHIMWIRNTIASRARDLYSQVPAAVKADANPHNFREGVQCREHESATRAAAAEAEGLAKMIQTRNEVHG